ncbi:MAG: response regulator [Lachnospiraceae bacterium]|nr:response regulator [Lachnospiraceae bacterium]
MSNNQPPELLDRVSRISKIFLCIALAFTAMVLAFFSISNHSDVWESDPIRFIDSWTVEYSDGSTFNTGREFITKAGEAKSCTIMTTLPGDIKDNDMLFFYNRYDVKVYVDGEFRADFIEERDVNIPGGIVKYFYMLIPLEGSDSGKDIRIERLIPPKDGMIIPGTFISTRFGALSYLFRSHGMNFMLAFIVLTFALVVFIVSVVLRIIYKLKINMLYGALGIAVIASWLLTDSKMFPFVFSVNYINGTVNYLLSLLIPFAPAIYLNSVQHGRLKKSMSVLMIIAVINAVIWPLLHFTGIASFYENRYYANMVFVFLALYATGLLIYDAVKNGVRDYRYTFIGFLGFLICCIIELMMLLMVTMINATLPMVTGLGFMLVFVVMQQVEEFRKLDMEKQHAIDISEAKTQFLASMSHEIRTPINAILGMNEMILRENKDKVVGEYSRSIKTSGKMLLMLVNDVLDFSKIEAGKMEIVEAKFRLSEMLSDVISLVRERADEKGLELKTELTAEIPDGLISDEFRIRQILVNLINNAVKYTESGTVTLELGGRFAEGDAYELFMNVKDTGKGIKKEELPYLFEAFSRADVKSNVNIEGTGLGLAIVKSIVDSMNGDVSVESEYGVGSEFKVTLPVRFVDKEPLKNDFMDTKSSGGDETETCSFMAPDAKILAVDDNRSNLTIVKLFLKRTGIVPDLCGDGNRAVELCREKKYDLILLDHMMPAPDGIETLHMIRSDVKSLNKDTGAVVLTANAVAGSRQMYMDEGFDDYLTKPLDSKLLEQTVKNMLPADKVKEAVPEEEDDDGIFEFEPAGEGGKGSSGSAGGLKDKLAAIEGLDIDTAFTYCGGSEEMLAVIVGDAVEEGTERVVRMRKALKDNDYETYRIDSHSVKSSMAILGMKELSERAKQHEFAARDGDTDFIRDDSDAFVTAYEKAVTAMANAL